MAMGARFGLIWMLVVGCVGEPQEVTELVGEANGGAVVLIDALTGEHVDVDDGSLCACASDACADEWVLEHIGCDVCVVVFCSGEDLDDPDQIPPDGTTWHACARCPSDAPPVPGEVTRHTSASTPR